MPVVATDSFTRADAATLGANWADVGISAAVVSNEAQQTVLTAYSGNSWSANVFDDAQYSQIVCKVANYCAPAVRMTGQNWYAYYNHGALQRSISGSVTDLSSGFTTFGASDVAKVTASGSTIDGFKNGVAAGSVSDATHATGSAGVMFYANVGKLDDWEGGNLGGGGATVRPWYAFAQQ